MSDENRIVARSGHFPINLNPSNFVCHCSGCGWRFVCADGEIAEQAVFIHDALHGRGHFGRITLQRPENACKAARATWANGKR